MPPICAVTVGAPLESIVPSLVKPLPSIAYETSSMVTPGATVKLSPSEPTSPLSLPVSLAQPMIDVVAQRSANDKRDEVMPSRAPNAPFQCLLFMNGLRWPEKLVDTDGWR